MKFEKTMKFVLLSLVSGCFVSSGYAETRMLSPIDDARTNAFEADTNLNDVLLLTAESFPNRFQYSYLKFDLSVIPSNEVIVGATLNLFQVGAGGPGVAFGNDIFHFPDDSWSESTITWNSALTATVNALGSARLATNADTDNLEYKQWDLFQFMNWNASADRADGVLSLMVADVIGGDSAYSFCSKESDPLQDLCLAAGETGFGEDRDPFLTVETMVLFPDADNDGVADDNDNCVFVQNGPDAPDAGGQIQYDSNSDGFGNACDPDLNNDNVVDFGDLPLLRDSFFAQLGDNNFNPDADMNGDNVVDFADLPTFQNLFFQPPGPSGLAP